MISARLRKARQYLKRTGHAALLVSSTANVRYLSGFTGEECHLLITPHHALFLGDFRYILQAEKEVSGSFQIARVRGSIVRVITELVAKYRLRSLCLEAQYVSVAFYNTLREKAGSRLRLIPVQGVIEILRQVKSPQELVLIRKAVSITKKALRKLKPYIKTGISEWYLKHRMERLLSECGAEAPSFDIIVASGPHAAMPHAKTTARKIRPNEPVIIDVGAVYRGYKSDLTRTFFSGTMTQYAKYYQLVANAQHRAIERVAPQVSIQSIDHAARRVFDEAGVGEFFGHALGHGVGLEVHEAPTIAERSTLRVKRNMVFTVEPGLYMPAWGGIRIEDMVVVTDRGCEVL